jgi:hypothetical protein
VDLFVEKNIHALWQPLLSTSGQLGLLQAVPFPLCKNQAKTSQTVHFFFCVQLLLKPEHPTQ